jgi:hypothetical protein
LPESPSAENEWGQDDRDDILFCQYPGNLLHGLQIDFWGGDWREPKCIADEALKVPTQQVGKDRLAIDTFL